MKHRYSFLIIPLQLLIDCLSIFMILYYVSDLEFYNLSFIIYIISFWTLSSFLTNYYKVLRFTKILRILSLTFRHFFIFILGFFAFFGIFKEGSVINNQFLIKMFKDKFFGRKVGELGRKLEEEKINVQEKYLIFICVTYRHFFYHMI